MGLKGSVRALSLDQLLEFLSASGHAGTLKITFKDKSCVLCLKDGTLYIDQRGKGAIRLGEILIQRGVVARDAVKSALETQQSEGGRIGDILIERGQATDEDLAAAYRAQLEEEIYDLFVLEDAFFEFDKGLPEDFSTEGQPGFAVRSILMEAARRFDQWGLIQKTINSRKRFYVISQEDGTLKKIQKSLEGDLDAFNLFGVERSIEELLPLLETTPFQALSQLAYLISEGWLVPVEARDLESRFRELLNDDLSQALSYYECALETPELESRQHQLDKQLFQLPAFRDAVLGHSFGASMRGKRALQMLLSLFRQQISCELHARQEDRELRVVLAGNRIVWKGGSTEGHRELLRYLKTQRLVSAADIEEADELHRSTSQSFHALLVGSGKITEEDWLRAKKWALLNKIFDLFFWKLPFVQVQTGAGMATPAEDGDLELELEDWLEEEVTNQVKDWERVTRIVPSVRAFFVLTAKGEKSVTSAVDDLNLFDGRRSLEQIMRLLRKTPEAFFSWLHEQHQAGRVEAVDEEGYRKRLEAALATGKLREAIAYCHAAIDSDLQASYFKDRLDEIQSRNQEGSEEAERVPAKIEGDLASFSLAELVQSFHMSKSSGTLRIYTETREKEIYLESGQVYLLEIEEIEDNFLMDASFTSSFDVVASGVMSEDELSDQVAQQIKEDVYEVFLWEEALFEFKRDFLRDEFHETSSRVTKFSLNTSMFLLEAVRRATEWERVREIVPNDELVVAFDSYEAKMRTVTERGADNQEVLLLIDGRHTITKIIDISNSRRFHAVYLISELLEAGTLHVVEKTEGGESPGAEERAGEVTEAFPEVMKGLQTDNVRGLLRVTDGRQSREIALLGGKLHRTQPFRQATGETTDDIDMSTSFFARDFAEVLVWETARYQFLPDVLPPVLEKGGDGASLLELLTERFYPELAAAASQWRLAIGKVDRDKPLGWIDPANGAAMAAVVPTPANVIDWVDGRRSAEDILRAHPDGRFLALMSLMALLDNGIVVYAEPEATEEGDSEEDWDFGL